MNEWMEERGSIWTFGVGKAWLTRKTFWLDERCGLRPPYHRRSLFPAKFQSCLSLFKPRREEGMLWWWWWWGTAWNQLKVKREEYYKLRIAPAEPVARCALFEAARQLDDESSGVLISYLPSSLLPTEDCVDHIAFFFFFFFSFS